MISKDTIELIKSTAKAHEVIGEFIELKKAGTEFTACCPFHSEKTPSFKVNVVENFYKCFGCGKSGDSIQFLQDYKKLSFHDSIIYLANKYKIQVMEEGIKKDYIRPEWRNNTNLSDKVVKWFGDVRKISQSTLKLMRIGESKQWMPEHKYRQGETIKTLSAGERNVIEFNYFRDGAFINTKFRDSVKSMRMIKDAELCFYNIDSMRGAKEVVILEGELDCLTIAEIGYPHGNISVPNGANVKSNNMVYLDTAIELFEQSTLERILVGTDNDAAGRKLREDLAERLGKERCFYIDWKDCKDANEVLVKHGKEAVWDCINHPKEFPIVGAFAPSTFADEVDDMYVNGLDPGCGLGMEQFDKLIRYAKGYITTITGIPSHGKTSILDQIVLKLVISHGWKFAFYSPENKPTKLHISKLARMLIGKNWTGHNRISEQEKNLVMRFIEGKIWFIKPEKDFTLDSILETVKILKKQKGIDAFVIDAWNRLEHKYGGGVSETKYINESLTKLDSFTEMNSLHCFLVAHPTKLEKDKKTGLYPVPTLYNISGAAHFYNITANGMSVYRDFGKYDPSTGRLSGGRTKVYVQKVKFSHWGEQGLVELEYDKDSGRFNEVVGENFIADKSNWITKENHTIPMNFADGEQNIGIVMAKEGEDDPF